MSRIPTPSPPGIFLGGALAPIGLCVSFLQRPAREALEALAEWRKGLGRAFDQREVGVLPDAAAALSPLQAPWTRELLVDCGDWTAYLNNGIDGGDASAAAPALAKRLKCLLAVAVHSPMHGPGHASTQLILQGPGGKPPLMYIRTLAAHAEDGRWSWYESGTVQPWEQPERYTARKVRDRFDRELLVSYLATLGIRVDAPDFYGRATAVQQLVTFKPREETVAEVRARFGWSSER